MVVKNVVTTLEKEVVLGIFVGIPAAIGFGIVATYKLGHGLATRAEKAQTVGEAKVQPA